MMRKPDDIEWLYLDFDGFFASVMQQVYPKLRGKPVGVVPFDGTDRTVVIACSREAKARGCKNIMAVREAKQICPSIILVPQEPDLYRRAHNALLAEINTVIPISAIKSIDELTCWLDKRQRQRPHELAKQIKDRLAKYVGPHITCSIGFAPNRQLAKIACKMDKPNGITIWTPDMVPEVLYGLPYDDIPGIGERMAKRLHMAGIHDMEKLMKMPAKHMRKIWRSVNGERLWYALHGYEFQAQETERGMFGHGRVLPPEERDLSSAKNIARLLLRKAARRLRRADYYASSLILWLAIDGGSAGRHIRLPYVNDDKAILDALDLAWSEANKNLSHVKVYRVHVTLLDITPANTRQLDMFVSDDKDRKRWEAVTSASDDLNMKYGKTIVSMGEWKPPKGGHVGAKISFTRIPSAEDFL
jgi:DNA polymerase-4